MSIILEKFATYRDTYKDFIPKSVYETLGTISENRAAMLEPTEEDRTKYFIEDLEDLSMAVFNLLYSGYGYYIVNYAHDFSVNRKAAGFKTKEDLIHYAIWVIQDFLSTENDTSQYEELKSNSIGKTDKEMEADVFMEKAIYDELEEVTYNAKDENDMIKRFVLLEELKKYKSLGYHLLRSYRLYQIIDDIYLALEAIPNVHRFNIPPEPMKQSIWDSSMV